MTRTHAAQPITQWLWLTGVLFVYAFATNRLTYQLVPDSPSYLEYPFGSLDAALRNIRTPGYPIFLRMVQATFGLAAVPLLQLLLHSTASWLLMRELQRWGTAPIACWAAGLAVAMGCTPLDNLAIVSTDAFAASVGVMVAVMLLRWVWLQRTLASAIPVVVLAVLSIAVRPAYLVIIPWVGFAGVLLAIMPPTRAASEPRKVSWRRVLFSNFALVVAISLPVLGWIGLRGVIVDDYGLLPFGHQNLAGITAQLVSDEELIAMRGEPGRLANEFLQHRDELFANQPWLAQGDPRATMTIETRWNPYVWNAIVPAANVLYPNDAIASHRLVKQFNRAIMERYPLRYFRWLALGARRAVWGSAANILMNPMFLLGVTIIAVIELVRILAGNSRPPSISGAGVDALFVIALTYFVFGAGFIILTSPPLGRFVDANAIFIPAWFAAKWFAIRFGGTRQRGGRGKHVAHS